MIGRARATGSEGSPAGVVEATLGAGVSTGAGLRLSGLRGDGRFLHPKPSATRPAQIKKRARRDQNIVTTHTILAVAAPNGQTAAWSDDEGLPVRARRG